MKSLKKMAEKRELQSQGIWIISSLGITLEAKKKRHNHWA
jgi:hypothetical protein